jgi:TolA-binding protein
MPPVPSIGYPELSAVSGSASLRGAREQIELLKEELRVERDRSARDQERQESELARVRDFYSEQSALSVASIRQEKDAVITRLQTELDTVRASSSEQIAKLNARIHELELENNRYRVTNEIDEKYDKELENFKNKSGGLSDGSTITALLQALPALLPMVQGFFSSQQSSPAPQMAAVSAPGFQQTAQAHGNYPPTGMPPVPPPPTPPVRYQSAPHPNNIIIDE